MREVESGRNAAFFCLSYLWLCKVHKNTLKMIVICVKITDDKNFWEILKELLLMSRILLLSELCIIRIVYT